MPVPAVPAEIVLHVLDLATSDLIEAERLATPPAQSTNAFLAAASLVSKTWRPIAQSLLLRKGIIPLPNIDSFLEEIRKRGIRPSTVRVSAGNPTLGTTARGATDDPGSALLDIFNELGPLKELEFIGSGLDSVGDDPDWECSNDIDHLRLTNQGGLHLDRMWDFSIFFPRRLSIHQTASAPPLSRRAEKSFYERPSLIDCCHSLTFVAASEVEHLDLALETSSLAVFAFLITGCRSQELQSCLRSLSLTEVRRTISRTSVQGSLEWAVEFPHLTDLALHLYHLPEHASVTLPPSIESLRTLPNAPHIPNKRLRVAQATIIRVANTLPALRKLVVPEYWRGEELEEYCDGCGVELVVYDHLMLGS